MATSAAPGLSTFGLSTFLEHLTYSRHSNEVIGCGLIALVAERLIQHTLSKEVTGIKLLASWICKGIQISINASGSSDGRFLIFYRSLGDMALPFTLLVNPDREQLITLKRISCIVSNVYKLQLSYLIGYRVDRFIKLTERAGPVMVVTSVALALLSLKNVYDDYQNLATYMDSVAVKSATVKKSFNFYNEYGVRPFAVGMVVVCLYAVRYLY